MFILLFHFDSEGCAVGELDVIECGLEAFFSVAVEITNAIIERLESHVCLVVFATHNTEWLVFEHFLPTLVCVIEGTVGRFGFDAELTTGKP